MAALVLGSSVHDARAVTPEWTYIGTGPLVTSTGKTAVVPFPPGMAQNDVALMGCQGRNNDMYWTAGGFSPTVNTPRQLAYGPGGLRFLLLASAAFVANPAPVTVTNRTGQGGWSCSITAFSSGMPWGFAIERKAQPGTTAAMKAPELAAITSATELSTHWCTSRDDNNHGRSSHGRVAFGGSAYDTTIGLDHAASMTWHVGPKPSAPEVTMRQQSNGPDPWTCVTAVIQAAQ
jgi:hypothetical protein